MKDTEYTPVVMTENVRAVTATEEIDLVYGQTIDEELADKLGPGKMKSLTMTRQAIPEAEFEKFDRARNRPNPDARRFDVPADEATVESLSSPDGNGGTRKIEDRPLPPDHPMFGRPRPAVAGGEPITGMQQKGVPLAGPVTTASEQMSQQRTSGAQGRPAWHGMATQDLELDEATKEILIKRNLTNAGEILDEGRKHKGLQHIDGIGAGREENIKKAIEAIPKATPVE